VTELLNKRAVALRYEQNSAAPRIVAKGAGYVAQTIIDRAQDYQVPIAIEPELVELLVQLDLNQLIPPQLYAAVAEALRRGLGSQRLAGDHRVARCHSLCYFFLVFSLGGEK